MRHILWVLPILAVVACDKSDSDDDGFGPGAPAALNAVAVAGDDFEVVTSAPTVTLNGSKSSDPAGGTPTFAWTQTAGVPVTLSDPAVASPTFPAPATEGDLVFQLTVTGAEGADVDTVTVSVKSLVVSAPDTWFAGYEKAGSIAASVSGGTGPYAFEWLGVGPWLNASGTATPTLTFTTPRLTDFQTFPDVASVALFKRSTQGRLQLTVRVTDSLGAVDEDFVNFSVGPFADTAANENVALGEPAFLNGAATANGATITSWSWTGIKPTGAAISFLKPDKTALSGATDQRFVYFVPDLPGQYQVILTQNPGGVVKVIDITSGKYVGVGGQAGAPPDPFKGECASCHGGQFPWLADFASTWKQTGHAKMFERLLDPADPYHAAVQAKGSVNDAFDFGSDYSVDSRTVGFSRITSVSAPNDGFAQVAAAEGFVLKGATWSEMVRKHPKTAAKANVQCESCHGPGSEHAGDTAGIRKSFDATLCGRCHSGTHDLWEASGHGHPPLSAAGSASCNGCHSAQGYVVEMRAQEGAEPHAALFGVSNPNRPVIPADDRRGISCQACHDPHKKTAKRPDGSMEPQLRAFGNVQFRNGAVSNAGEAAVCYTCHQSRTDTTFGSPDMNVRRAPHDSTAAEMLAGTNGQQVAGWTYAVSPHGIPAKFLKSGQTSTRQCLSCHADAQPAPGAVGFGALGGHTFRLKQGTGGTIASEATHSGAATVAGTRKFTIASGSTFLRSVFAGDTLTISAGADTGAYTVASVDGSRQLTLATGPTFGGGAVTAWSVTSVVKHNTAACTQCHATALDFQMAARADYDGDATIESVQDEIAGLRTTLAAAVDARLVTLIGAGTFHTIGNGRVRYNKNGGGTLRTFPGPSVTTSDNPDIAWTSLTGAQQAEWQDLYAAVYNIVFVTNDRSEGIHNTGYAVNLLQASYQAVTGAPIGSAFVPFP